MFIDKIMLYENAYLILIIYIFIHLYIFIYACVNIFSTKYIFSFNVYMGVYASTQNHMTAPK